jgi:hypothetical protein
MMSYPNLYNDLWCWLERTSASEQMPDATDQQHGLKEMAAACSKTLKESVTLDVVALS